MNLQSVIAQLTDRYLELDEEQYRITRAIDVLRELQQGIPGDNIPVPESSTSRIDVQADPTPAPIKEVYTGPTCNGCGSSMYSGSRTLGNGKTVNMLICNDSGCNNEQFA